MMPTRTSPSSRVAQPSCVSVSPVTTPIPNAMKVMPVTSLATRRGVRLRLQARAARVEEVGHLDLVGARAASSARAQHHGVRGLDEKRVRGGADH